LLAWAAEQDGDLVGFTVAESHARGVRVLTLEGGTAICQLLLDKLVRLAGERDVSGWCPADRPDVQKLFETRGFLRQYLDDFQGCPSYLYHCSRNEAH